MLQNGEKDAQKNEQFLIENENTTIGLNPW